MELNFLSLIQKAQAEGADSVAAPTFPFTVPGGGVVNPPATNEPGITLQTDSTNVEVGDEFKVKINVDSKTTNISGFTTSITFDPAFLVVLDSNTAEQGIQVDYLDTVFLPIANTVNNNSGIISLRSEAGENQQSTVNRTVAEIEFRAIKKGSSQIKVVEENSNILNVAGIDILSQTNALNINIASQTNTGTNPPPPPIIPKTGFADEAGILVMSISGILLITAGLYLSRVKKRK